MEEDTTTGTETPATEPGEGEPEKIGEEGVVDHGEVRGEGDELEGEHMEGEHMEGEHMEGEHMEGEHMEKVLGEGEELMGEELEGEQVQEEQKKEAEKEEEPPVEEEEQYVEEPPPDPAAPYDFSDSKEALKAPFELRPDQLAEVEQLWALYQDYTPAYTDIDNYITEKELFYMLKALLLMTYTPEQFQELIQYVVRPPHPEGHITFEQFVKIVTLRQRDFPIEEELRAALQVYDPEHTGSMDRETLKDSLLRQGHKMPQKQLDNLIKEVDLANDGTIGVEDVIGTMCIDLNTDDIVMLRNTLNPDYVPPPPDDDD